MNRWDYKKGGYWLRLLIDVLSMLFLTPTTQALGAAPKEISAQEILPYSELLRDVELVPNDELAWNTRNPRNRHRFPCFWMRGGTLVGLTTVWESHAWLEGTCKWRIIINSKYNLFCRRSLLRIICISVQNSLEDLLLRHKAMLSSKEERKRDVCRNQESTANCRYWTMLPSTVANSPSPKKFC